MTYPNRRSKLYLLTYPVVGIKKAAPWYLSGGISKANCIAAYQPKGAANLAASYVNLANPGTYNAAPGTAPDWDATNGWKFTTASQHYLTTSVTPENDQTWSMIARFSNGRTDESQFIAECQGASSLFGFSNSFSSKRFYANGGQKSTGSPIASGVMAIAGNKGYLDGSVDVSSIGSAGGDLAVICIGCQNDRNATRGYYATAYIQALAIYDAVLTADQVAALTTAMNAL